MNAESKSITINVWSDFVCPWCWIAKRRFEMALADFEHKDLVQVNYKAFRLAAGQKAAPIKQVLVQKFGNEQSANGMIQAVVANAREVGLVYNFDTMLFGDTTKAHALVKAVDDSYTKMVLSERLYEASTTDGRSIFEESSLAEIAADVGISASFVQRAWNDEALPSLIAKDEKEAHEIANGVPLFVFNNGFYISGAQTVDAFKQALQRMHLDAIEAESFQGQTCGLNGCDN
ncbi:MULTISPECIES: DsbA family oxidoreductase [Pseudomonas]|uniref:DsbA family oxidoreductase n=1 Tax=Pseudomonas TaxID=286 RepID=UPI000C29FD40|nr:MULTISPECIES: DsbA family oxidoreductase [Pseudomonas]PJY96965.1 isomerase [Pseudomonas donghuensis]WKY30343.1 DsbA family oxidoreductase [Pseudomonas donghuensis]